MGVGDDGGVCGGWVRMGVGVSEGGWVGVEVCMGVSVYLYGRCVYMGVGVYVWVCMWEGCG